MKKVIHKQLPSITPFLESSLDCPGVIGMSTKISLSFEVVNGEGRAEPSTVRLLVPVLYPTLLLLNPCL